MITGDLPELREAGGEARIYIEPTEEAIRNGILTAPKRKPAQGLDWRDWSWSKSAAILAQVLLGPTSIGSCLAQHLAAVSLTH
jgi:hypothetical protein